jgi:hypothetical protein
MGGSDRQRTASLNLSRELRCQVGSVQSEFLKKLLQQLLAFLFENPSHDLDPVVQAGLVCEIEHRSAGAGFRIPGAKDYMGNARQNDSSKAHGAGFESHVECRVGESPTVQRLGSFTDYDHFGMGRGVSPDFSIIVGLRENRPAVYQHCGDRHFSDESGTAG